MLPYIYFFHVSVIFFLNLQQMFNNNDLISLQEADVSELKRNDPYSSTGASVTRRTSKYAAKSPRRSQRATTPRFEEGTAKGSSDAKGILKTPVKSITPTYVPKEPTTTVRLKPAPQKDTGMGLFEGFTAAIHVTLFGT